MHDRFYNPKNTKETLFQRDHEVYVHNIEREFETGMKDRDNNFAKRSLFTTPKYFTDYKLYIQRNISIFNMFKQKLNTVTICN